MIIEKNIRVILVNSIVLLALLPLSAYSTEPNSTNQKMTEIETMKTLVAGNNDFAFAFYGKLNEIQGPLDTNSNVFFSPYSISSCFSMIYAGARGETQHQIAEALGFRLPYRQLCQTFGALQEQLIQNKPDCGYQLLVANSLWCQKGEAFLKDFLAASKLYEDGLAQIDFINETEKSRQCINLWVEDKTQRKIQDLIPAGSLGADTRLVIADAVYFKGKWKIRFENYEIEPMDFHISAGHSIPVHMMGTKDHFRYYADEFLQAVELAYKGDQVSMVIILPQDEQDQSTIEKKFSAAKLNDILSKMYMTEIEIFLPKFNITWGTVSLRKVLTSLGIRDAFLSGKADLSGLNGKKDLLVSDIFHKTYIEVNEKGTEAAAATGAEVVLGDTPDKTPVFLANHPFMFIIRDNCSGTILFMGRLMNPMD